MSMCGPRCGRPGTAAWRPVAAVRDPGPPGGALCAPCELAQSIGERKVKVQPYFRHRPPACDTMPAMEPTSFTHYRSLRSAVPSVWPCLTRPELLAGWIGEADMELRPDGALVLKLWHGDAIHGRVMAAVPTERVALAVSRSGRRGTGHRAGGHPGVEAAAQLGMGGRRMERSDGGALRARARSGGHVAPHLAFGLRAHRGGRGAGGAAQLRERVGRSALG